VKYLSVHGLAMTGEVDSIDTLTDAVYEHLLEMSDVIDPDMAVNLAEGKIDVQMIVEASDELEASAKAACILRTAIHAVGGATWGWEKHIRGVTASTRAIELAQT
jgi:hypothetical protein